MKKFLYLLQSIPGSSLYWFVSELPPSEMEEDGSVVLDYIQYNGKNPCCNNRDLTASFKDAVYFVNEDDKIELLN